MKSQEITTSAASKASKARNLPRVRETAATAALRAPGTACQRPTPALPGGLFQATGVDGCVYLFLDVRSFIDIFMYVCINSCLYSFICVCIYLHDFTCLFIHLFIYIFICVYIHIHVVCVCVRTYSCIHVPLIVRILFIYIWHTFIVQNRL